jgi:hypothetical protein
MKIDAFNQVGMDLGDENNADKIAKNIPDCDDGLLTLDLRRCIIDYRATSLILDAALEKIHSAPSPRKLIIIYDIKFQERLFLKWLFLGSRLLGLDNGTFTDDVIRKRLDEFLTADGIELYITILDPKTDMEIHVFSYGK